MQNPLVLYVLGHAHFVEYETVPDPEELEKKDLPIGALILSTQAVSTKL